ncbi:MAG TPA: hypothetical protein VNB29_04920, partial [Chthoniobacterales bacterium]|nr:hypothetical protein [Chthoniobacterales bacterium]
MKTVPGTNFSSISRSLLLALAGTISLTQATMALDAVKLGADVPYLRYEAERGKLTGAAVKVGPSRKVGDLAGEASGREAVKLINPGDGVEWVATEAANSIVIRSSIPDSVDGAGQDATISVFVNGRKRGTVGVTSRYAWLYGPEGEPKNQPSLGNPRRIYDETHQLFDFTIQKGDRVMLKKDSGDEAAYYGIDFVELEMVAPPKPCPEGFVNIADEGLTPENFGSKIAGLIQNFEWK